VSVNCGPSFGCCAVRLTRVASNGSVIAGLNSYVTDKPISVAVAPNYETGNTFSQRNGCGCGIARLKAPDTFNWFDITFTEAALEPVMQAFLLGASEITDGFDVVGVSYPGQLACDDDEPAVALEFWTQHINGSSQDAQFPWIHWVFPMSVWRLGDNTAEEGFMNPVVVGFTKTNPLWGNGPYGDGPPDGENIEEGGWWYTDVEPPSAECAAQNVTATS